MGIRRIIESESHIKNKLARGVADSDINGNKNHNCSGDGDQKGLITIMTIITVIRIIIIINNNNKKGDEQGEDHGNN